MIPQRMPATHQPTLPCQFSLAVPAQPSFNLLTPTPQDFWQKSARVGLGGLYGQRKRCRKLLLLKPEALKFPGAVALFHLNVGSVSGSSGTRSLLSVPASPPRTL